MLGPAASGPLQRPLLLASGRIDVGTAVHVTPVQGGTIGPEAVTPRDVCNPTRDLDEDDGRGRSGSTTSSVRQPTLVKRSVCCRRAEERLEIYAQVLETNPLRTKCMTSAVIGGLGDIIAQGVLWSRGGDTVWCNTNAVWQTVAVTIQNFVFNAPFLHFTYGALERWIPTEKSLAGAITQVAIDVLVIDPILAIAFIVQVGLLEGQSFGEDIVPTIKADYLTLVFWLTLMGLIVAPVQVYLFKRFPLKWRVLISDAKDVLWTVVACFIVET